MLGETSLRNLTLFSGGHVTRLAAEFVEAVMNGERWSVSAKKREPSAPKAQGFLFSCGR
jgi:hypothetical protein